MDSELAFYFIEKGADRVWPVVFVLSLDNGNAGATDMLGTITKVQYKKKSVKTLHCSITLQAAWFQ